MFADDRHADAEEQAGAAAGTLGGEKWIEEFGQDFRGNPDAIVLHRGGDTVSGTTEADLDTPAGSRFADGLFGIADKVQENLDELVGVADDGRQARDGVELDLDIVAAERMILELKCAVNDHVEIQYFFLWRGWPRKFEKVLDDAGSAAGLAVGHFQLALGIVVHALTLAEKFACPKNGGERIVQFVSDTGEHLAHSGEFFSLDELALEAFDLGDVTA